MDLTQIILHRDYPVARVDPRIFGGFLEHVGRAVYEGVYDPQSKHANENGERLALVVSLPSGKTRPRSCHRS